MWSRDPNPVYPEPDAAALRRRRLRSLRPAAWALLVAGVVLFVIELGFWWALAGLVALVVAVVGGGYVLVRTWPVWPRQRWLGLLPLVTVALVLWVDDPVARLAGIWLLLGLGLTLLAKAR